VRPFSGGEGRKCSATGKVPVVRPGSVMTASENSLGDAVQAALLLVAEHPEVLQAGQEPVLLVVEHPVPL
jgi:hypothetical protein